MAGKSAVSQCARVTSHINTTVCNTTGIDERPELRRLRETAATVGLKDSGLLWPPRFALLTAHFMGREVKNHPFKMETVVMSRFSDGPARCRLSSAFLQTHQRHEEK